MDKLALLHPSLGLAFTAEFKPRDLTELEVKDMFRNFMQGNKAEDGLPIECDGCKEDLSGALICCQKELFE